MTFRMFFISFDGATTACYTPSDVVLGGGMGGRAQELQISSGGEGSDCVLPLCFRVLCLNSEDYDVISIFFGVLFVICNITDEK